MVFVFKASILTLKIDYLSHTGKIGDAKNFAFFVIHYKAVVAQQQEFFLWVILGGP